MNIGDFVFIGKIYNGVFLLYGGNVKSINMNFLFENNIVKLIKKIGNININFYKNKLDKKKE